MGLQVERVGDVVVVVPEGMLKGGSETDELRKTLRRLVDEGQKKILLDFAKTTHITSIAIGVLASMHASAASHGARLFVCNSNERIRNVWAHIFALLKPTLTLHDTRENALQALTKV